MEFFKKKDIIIISAIILFGITFWLIYKGIFSKEAAKAEIYYGSELVKTVELKTGSDIRFTVPQDKNVVFHLYKDGSIAFEESDCPDKICIKSGKLRMVGETAACLPNKLIMKIVPANGRGTDDIDMIVGR
jgi:hypothetical protein